MGEYIAAHPNEGPLCEMSWRPVKMALDALAKTAPGDNANHALHIPPVADCPFCNPELYYDKMAVV